MSTVMQKIKDIEDEMARTQKNKATAHHLGLLKAKLAKLRRELLEPTTKGGGGAGEGFDVTKSGDARVGLVGFPSVGKSTLLNKLTGTFSEVASYEFTTLTCIPGVITYRGARIQLLDLPGIIEGAKDGKGRGRQVISTARTCNCILIVLDAIKPITHKRLIEKELEGFGIRLNKEPPNMTFRKKEKGGINFTSTVANTNLDLDTVKAICSEYRIHNADVSLRFDATADDLIDVIEGSRKYIPCIYAVNKIDQISLEELEILDKLPHYCPVGETGDRGGGKMGEEVKLSLLPPGLLREAMPRHVAVIMDGNSRWARVRRLPVSAGHEAGYRALREVIELSSSWGIRALTVFAFSTENWLRPKAEVDFLMRLFERLLKENLTDFNRNGVRICVIGDTSKLPESLLNLSSEAEENTKHNTHLELIVALSYSGRNDIVQACQKVAHKVKDGILDPSDVTESIIAEELETNCTGNFPYPDLLIRTSGELRLSNFLLWQSAYTELFFTESLWPDFGEADYIKALTSFQQRQRRYGRRN